jgi:branched-chain amino acid transport system ATP-binding protein
MGGGLRRELPPLSRTTLRSWQFILAVSFSMLLQVTNLNAGYGAIEVLRGVSLHVCQGEIVALLGANGAGKTTLLKAIVGLIPAWGGSVRVQNRPTKGQPPWRAVSNSMMLVPEGRQIFADMTVRENLIIGGYHNPDREMDFQMVLDRFPKMRERINQLGGTLSGGEQQMLALARALMARPRLLLLDEPSMGLAPLMVKDIFNQILSLRESNLTVMLVEQNAAAALQIADRAYVMETGEILMEGDATSFLQNPQVKRAYLGKGYREVWE